jgi:hypothetical protein
MLLLRNDLQQQWKKIWIATLASAGVGLLVYLTNVDPRAAIRPAMYEALFAIVLIGGGLIYTSAIFADLHHPLQRFHFLTLPCSNLERFLSRYLLSAPLYYLYVLVTYAIFDWTAAQIAETTVGAKAAPFAPFDPWILKSTLIYFGMHALMFCGAIYFRSHALAKTVLSVALIALGMIAAHLVAVRVLYWNYFTTLLPTESGIPIPFLPIPRPLFAVVVAALYLWVLYLAYQCLREHEVQREL